MEALREWASVCHRQTEPPTSAGKGVPEDACFSRLQARGNHCKWFPHQRHNKAVALQATFEYIAYSLEQEKPTSAGTYLRKICTWPAE